MPLRTRDELAPFFAAAAAEAKSAWDAAEQARIETGGNVTPNSPAEPYLPLADFLEDAGDPRSVVVKAHWSDRPTPPRCGFDDYLDSVHLTTLPDGTTIRLDAYRGGVVTHWDGFQPWAAQADKLDAPLPFSAALTLEEAMRLAESLPEGETVTIPEGDYAARVTTRETPAQFLRRTYAN